MKINVVMNSPQEDRIRRSVYGSSGDLDYTGTRQVFAMTHLNCASTELPVLLDVPSLGPLTIFTQNCHRTILSVESIALFSMTKYVHVNISGINLCMWSVSFWKENLAHVLLSEVN